MSVYTMSNHVSERMSIVRRESMADIPLKDRIGSVSWRVAEDCGKEEAWRRVWQRRKRRGRRNCSRMVASHPSTSADPAERQNARRRHPLNNEALGFYACLTSPRERSFSPLANEKSTNL